MPSSATITAFYNFTANTKARATQVNTNFSNFRGHLVAIDPNTATAATTETYDLGSSEYRWRTGYFRDIDLKSNTSTGQVLQIIGDTAAGSSAFNFHVGSTLPGQIGYNGFVGNLYGQLNKPMGPTTTASIGQISRVQIAALSMAGTSTATPLVGTTISINSQGRPVAVSIINDNTSSSILYTYASTATSSHSSSFELYLYRATTQIGVTKLGCQGITISASQIFEYPRFDLIDTSAPAGLNTYHIRYRNTGANSSFAIDVGIIYAKEI